MDPITVELPIKAVSEANTRTNRYVLAQRKKLQRNFARLVLNRYRVRFRSHRGMFVVTLTRIASRELDDDNLASSFKAIRDGVADAIGVDDGSKRFRWIYAQEKGKPKTYSIRIRVELPVAGEE